MRFRSILTFKANERHVYTIEYPMKDKPFIDRAAIIGRPKLMPTAEVNIPARPFSRSLNDVAKKENLEQKLHCEIKSGYLHIETRRILGDKIKVNKTNAVKFALWILSVLDNKRSISTNATHRKAPS